MKKNILLIAIITLFPVNVAAELRDLIKQNVQNAEKSYERTISPVEEKTTSVRLWIHVRNENQKNLGEEIFQAIVDTSIGGRRTEKKPIQIITFGPQQSQLRYFKETDKSSAEQLFKSLRDIIPELELRDLSREYTKVRWIKPGHFELWLAPDLVKIKSPE